MNPSENRDLFIKTVFRLVLDYIRWTQLVPMIIGWAFAIFMILAMFLISFESQINDMLYRAGTYVEYLLGPAPEEPGHKDTTLRITEDDILPWIYRIWGVLALLMWILDLIRVRIRGPLPKRRLKHKIALIGLAVGIYIVLYVTFFILHAAPSNTAGELMIAFTLPPVLLFVVSCWGVGISHYIDKIQDWMTTHELNPQESTKKVNIE